VYYEWKNAYYNSYTETSVKISAAFAIANQLICRSSCFIKKTDVDLVKPETVKAFELGYRGQLKNLI
jgi:hypothetical protein